MKRKPIVMPKFVNQAQEADWWASREGRDFLKQKTAGTKTKPTASKNSRLIGRLNKVRALASIINKDRSQRRRIT